MQPVDYHLLSFIRSALLGSLTIEYNEPIEWEPLFNLASNQGVVALLNDGIQLLYSNRDTKTSVSSIDDADNESVKYQLFGAQLSVESKFEELHYAYDKLSALLALNQVRCLALKGFSIANRYPIPSHRYFGDLDIYSPVYYKFINDLLISKKAKYDEECYRHTHWICGGISIENHLYLTDVRGQKRLERLENDLRNMVLNQLNSSSSYGLISPSVEFALVFDIYHSWYHFIYEDTSLKYVVDWMLLLKDACDKVDANYVQKMTEYGLIRYLAVLTSICIKYLGLSISRVPQCLLKEVNLIPDKLTDRTLNEILHPSEKKKKRGNVVRRGCSIAANIISNGWKIREFCGCSPIAFIIEKGIATLKG